MYERLSHADGAETRCIASSYCNFQLTYCFNFTLGRAFHWLAPEFSVSGCCWRRENLILPKLAGIGFGNALISSAQIFVLVPKCDIRYAPKFSALNSINFMREVLTVKLPFALDNCSHLAV